MTFETLEMGFEILETSFGALEMGFEALETGFGALETGFEVGLAGYKGFFFSSNFVWLFSLSFFAFFLN